MQCSRLSSGRFALFVHVESKSEPLCGYCFYTISSVGKNQATSVRNQGGDSDLESWDLEFMNSYPFQSIPVLPFVQGEIVTGGILGWRKDIFMQC